MTRLDSKCDYTRVDRASAARPSLSWYKNQRPQRQSGSDGRRDLRPLFSVQRQSGRRLAVV